MAVLRDPGDEDLRVELARYRALVEHAPDAIVILDVAAGRFVWVNAAAERLFGLDRDALLQVGPAELSPPEQPDGRPSEAAAMEYIERALAGEQPSFEWIHRRADGQDVPCGITLLRLPPTDQALVRGSILEITDRRTAEQARRDADAAQAAPAGRRGERGPDAGDGRRAERDRLGARPADLAASGSSTTGPRRCWATPWRQWLDDPGLWQRILHPDDADECSPPCVPRSPTARTCP